MKTAQDYFDQGKAFFDKGKYTEAINFFDQTIGLDKKFMEAYRFKCRSLNSLGQYYKSLEWCDKAIAIDPTYKYAYNLKGNALSDLGDKQLALEAYEKALSLDPNFGLALNGKANALGDLGRIEEAIKWYRATIKVDPDNRYAYGNLASYYERLKKFAEALDIYNIAVSKHPTNIVVLINRGRLLCFLGKTPEGFQDFRKVQELIQKGHVEADLSPGHVAYIMQTLKMISKLEDTFNQAEAELQKTTPKKSNLKYAETLKRLSKQKEELTWKAMDNVNINDTAKQKQSIDLIEKLQQELVNLTNRLNQAEAKVDEVKIELANVKEEVDNKLDDYNKMLQKGLNKLDLTPEDQNKVKEYYRAFVQTFESAYVTSQVIDSGLVKLDSESTGAKILSTFVSFIPFIGDTLSKGVKKIGDFLQSNEMKNNAIKMKSLATNSQDLNQSIGKTAYEVVFNANKQKQILKITFEDMKKASEIIMKTLKIICDNLENDDIDDISLDAFTFTYKSLYKTPQALLGHQDANNLIQEWIDMKILYQALFKERIISQVDNEGNIIKMISNNPPTSPNRKPPTKSECCNMF